MEIERQSSFAMMATTEMPQAGSKLRLQSLFTGLLYSLTVLIGLIAFAYPFFIPQLAQVGAAESRAARIAAAPLLTAVLLVLNLAVLLMELQGQAISAKVVATLGMLVSITAVLRFAEIALPGFGGFSLIFGPIILVGYSFGARFGFLMGSLTLLASALITGGVGPWLPYQMFATGWVGLTAGWLPRPRHAGLKLGILALWGLLWGLLFGLLMNLYFWPFLAGSDPTSWQPGSSLVAGMRRYLTFYAATSFVWDIGRSAGNVLFLLAFGLPILRVLDRFYSRFQFVGPARPPIRPVSGKKQQRETGKTAVSPPQPYAPAIHIQAWVAWLGASMAIALLTNNPLYLLILLLIVYSVDAAHRQQAPPFSLAKFGLLLLLIATLFNLLSVRVGETVLWQLPPSWPWIGGSWTLEAAVFGLTNGLVLFTIIAIFFAFNGATQVSELVRLLPNALRDVGLILLIGITYLPQTWHHLQRVRAAQAIRGHQIKGLRDTLPILLPLLIGGLERALQLAEAMVARGYGATGSQRQPWRVRLGLLLGLTAAVAGWLLTFWHGWLGWTLLLVGLALIGYIIWHSRQARQTTRLRAQRWTGSDSWLVAAALLPLLLLLLPLPFIDSTSRLFSPYPALTWPSFDPIIGLALLGLLTPVFCKAE